MDWVKDLQNREEDYLLQIVRDYDYLQQNGYLEQQTVLRNFVNEIKKARNDDSINFSLLATDVVRESLRELVRRSYKI